MCLNSQLLSVVFQDNCVRIYRTIIRLFLFSYFRTFATIVCNPLHIRSMISIMNNLITTLRCFQTASGTTKLLMKAIRRVLTTKRQRTKRRNHFNYLCIRLYTLHVSPIAASTSILLRNVISTTLRVPLHKRKCQINNLHYSNDFHLLYPRSITKRSDYRTSYC